MKEIPSEVIQSLNAGGIGVIPTDTLYGLVARALDSRAVERVYEARKRRPDKPCIILISDIGDLALFGISVDQAVGGIISQFWPGPVSIVLPCSKKEFVYLHRGTNTLAFRLPATEELRTLLKMTGPLIAPSANLEGRAPARTIDQARSYFEDTVDFYAESGELIAPPSTLIEIKDGKVIVLRQGSVKIP